MQSGRLYIIATEYHTTDSKQILSSITVNNNAADEDKRTKQKIHPFFAQKGKVDCCFLEQIFFSFTLLIVLSCTADNLCDLREESRLYNNDWHFAWAGYPGSSFNCHPKNCPLYCARNLQTIQRTLLYSWLIHNRMELINNMFDRI